VTLLAGGHRLARRCSAPLRQARRGRPGRPRGPDYPRRRRSSVERHSAPAVRHRPSHVRSVMVAGQWWFGERQLLTVDMSRTLDRTRDAARELWKRMERLCRGGRVFTKTPTLSSPSRGGHRARLAPRSRCPRGREAAPSPLLVPRFEADDRDCATSALQTHSEARDTAIACCSSRRSTALPTCACSGSSPAPMPNIAGCFTSPETTRPCARTRIVSSATGIGKPTPVSREDPAIDARCGRRHTPLGPDPARGRSPGRRRTAAWIAGCSSGVSQRGRSWGCSPGSRATSSRGSAARRSRRLAGRACGPHRIKRFHVAHGLLGRLTHGQTAVEAESEALGHRAVARRLELRPRRDARAVPENAWSRKPSRASYRRAASPRSPPYSRVPALPRHRAVAGAAVTAPRSACARAGHGRCRERPCGRRPCLR